MPRARLALVLFPLLLAPPALGGDWTNAGGNAARNGQSPEVGPATLLAPAWSGSRPSVIAWQPVSDGGRVFLVRQTGFVPAAAPLDSPVVCHDLDSGAELWAFHVPYTSGDWTAWIAGCSDGKVYCSRSGNGGSVAAPLYALDQATGEVAWVSVDEQQAGAYDGVVFAPDGDPIVAWHQKIMRIDAQSGATVWSANRVGSVSGHCGVALHGDALYAADAAPGFSIVIKRFDLATGAKLHESPTMPGLTVQNTPFVGPDGTVYLARTQNNPVTDFAYAFTDTGSALLTKWSVPTAWSTASELATGLDGSPYVIGPGKVLQRLDPATGSVTASSVPLSALAGNITPRLAVDATGRVYAGNGGFADGRVFCFTPGLDLLWSVAVPSVNIGAPCLAQDGTLVVAGVGSDLRAYRSGLPWSDVQQGLAGAGGLPELSGEGTLQAGTPVVLELEEAAPSALTVLFAGASLLAAPFRGGVLVPQPDALLGPFLTDGDGALSLAAAWPPGLPGGTALWLQHWIVDAGGPQGLAASNGLQAVTP